MFDIFWMGLDGDIDEIVLIGFFDFDFFGMINNIWDDVFKELFYFCLVIN